MDEIAMIDNIQVMSLLQKYDDGRPDKVWNIGDETTDGKIVSFVKNKAGYWYALTDTPSEWQRQRGYKNGWAYIFQLKQIGEL